LHRGGRYTTSQFRLLNRCVFSLELKVVFDGLDWIPLGREFHRVGDTKQKDHLAKADAMYGMVSNKCVDEWRVGLAGMLTATRSLRCDGVHVVTTLHVISAAL